MIPSREEAQGVWKTFALPKRKQEHSRLVAELALFFADVLEKKAGIRIRTDLLLAAALLHDIDKNIPHEKREHHPDTAVRILQGLGMGEVAETVRTHPLHAILDPHIAPKTCEEKLLFLADKMVKQKVISVDERFALWKKEHLSKKEQEILKKAYPKVKQLEQEVINRCGYSIMGSGGDVL